MKFTVIRGEQKVAATIRSLEAQNESLEVALDGEISEVRIIARRDDWLTLEINGRICDFIIFQQEEDWIVKPSAELSQTVQMLDPRRSTGSAHAGLAVEGVASLKAQMPGKVIRVLKNTGDPVDLGEGLVIIESMKMQNELKSVKAGKVRTCAVKDGQHVRSGQLLFEVE